MSSQISIAAPERPHVVVSRCDRLGDLVLSLPVLGYLRDAGFKPILHCARYAADVGEWARFNELCSEVWIEGDAPPAAAKGAVGLSLFHSPLTLKGFRDAGLKRTLGPRTKLSALWSYSKSIAQHRSRVEKSEMRYNLDLAQAFLKWMDCPVPEFQGLPALKVPLEWKSDMASPQLVIVVSNNGSAANWPLAKYEQWALRALNAGRSVSFLVSGLDAKERAEQLSASEAVRRGAQVVTNFCRVGELIAWLAGAKEVLSSSTGPLHLAHAAGVAVTGVYPDRPRQQTFARWRPDGYWHAAPVRYLEFSPA